MDKLNVGRENEGVLNQAQDHLNECVTMVDSLVRPVEHLDTIETPLLVKPLDYYTELIQDYKHHLQNLCSFLTRLDPESLLFLNRYAGDTPNALKFTVGLALTFTEHENYVQRDYLEGLCNKKKEIT
jgi:hypothetical protein